MELQEAKMNFTNTCKPCEEAKQKELSEAIKVLQKHLNENKELFNECFERNLPPPYDVKTANFYKDIAFKAAKNFLDNLIKE